MVVMVMAVVMITTRDERDGRSEIRDQTPAPGESSPFLCTDTAKTAHDPVAETRVAKLPLYCLAFWCVCCDKPARREVDISGFGGVEMPSDSCFPRGLAQTQKGKAGALPSLGMICLSRARTRQVLIGLGAGCGGTDRRHIFPDAECRPRRD
jgi:hypothetical protein